MHQGLEDVPALLSGGGDDGTHSGEVVGTPLGPSIAWRFQAPTWFGWTWCCEAIS